MNLLVCQLQRWCTANISLSLWSDAFLIAVLSHWSNLIIADPNIRSFEIKWLFNKKYIHVNIDNCLYVD